MVDSIGSATITEIAESGPRAQVRGFELHVLDFYLHPTAVDQDVGRSWHSVSANNRRTQSCQLGPDSSRLPTSHLWPMTGLFYT